jgi:tRNA(His) 5'-end guanylyltransferase
MKAYEQAGTAAKLMPMLPAIIRLDGRGFHNFTKGLTLPFDKSLRACFDKVTMALVEETDALIGYHQSDEISLCLYKDRSDQQLYFDGRVFKIASVLAATASLLFYREVEKLLQRGYADKLPVFDCRVFNVPNKQEAVNYFMWREWDATKNSITMAASTRFFHSELSGKNGSEKQEMLFQVGINWNDYPAAFKRGTYIRRESTEKVFMAEDLDKLPPKHAARKSPNLTVERTKTVVMQMPPLAQVTNRINVLFDKETPAVAAGVVAASEPEAS